MKYKNYRTASQTKFHESLNHSINSQYPLKKSDLYQPLIPSKASLFMPLTGT